jgi:hypothetical protein
VFASVAQWEREVIVSGHGPGDGPAPPGGRPISAPCVVDFPEIRQRIRRWRGRGWTYQRIADRLNRDAAPTLPGGSMWRVSSVQAAATGQGVRMLAQVSDLAGRSPSLESLRANVT